LSLRPGDVQEIVHSADHPVSGDIRSDFIHLSILSISWNFFTERV
jgi:hypothetical protein